MKTIEEAVRLQLREELGEGENADLKFGLLQKYGLAKPVDLLVFRLGSYLDRRNAKAKQVTRPTWMNMREWRKREGEWNQILKQYRKIKNSRPQPSR